MFSYAYRGTQPASQEACTQGPQAALSSIQAMQRFDALSVNQWMLSVGSMHALYRETGQEPLQLQTFAGTGTNALWFC